MKIVGFLKCYNELSKGHLERCIRNIEQYCDEIVACDDSSSDGSYEYLQNHCQTVIKLADDFKAELQHKQRLITRALELKPDWIVWLDPDETLDREWTVNMEDKLKELGESVDSVSFNYCQLWRSKSWRRLDELWATHWDKKIWRAKASLAFGRSYGLHHSQSPRNLDATVKGGVLVHYGFSTIEEIVKKYNSYKFQGQQGYALWRLGCEKDRVLARTEQSLFPPGDAPGDEVEPPLLTLEKWRTLLGDPYLSWDFEGDPTALLRKSIRQGTRLDRWREIAISLWRRKTNS